MKDPGIFNFKEHLAYGPDGDLAPVTYNIFLLLRYHPDWEGVIGLAEKSENVMALKRPPYSAGFSGPWTQNDNVLTACYLQKLGLMVSPAQVAETVPVVAASNEQGPPPAAALKGGVDSIL